MSSAVLQPTRTPPPAPSPEPPPSPPRPRPCRERCRQSPSRSPAPNPAQTSGQLPIAPRAAHRVGLRLRARRGHTHTTCERAHAPDGGERSSSRPPSPSHLAGGSRPPLSRAQPSPPVRLLVDFGSSARRPGNGRAGRLGPPDGAAVGHERVLEPLVVLQRPPMVGVRRRQVRLQRHRQRRQLHRPLLIPEVLRANGSTSASLLDRDLPKGAVVYVALDPISCLCRTGSHIDHHTLSTPSPSPGVRCP